MAISISASKTDLLLQCARPFQEGIQPDEESEELRAAGDYGQAFHAVMAECGGLKTKPADIAHSAQVAAKAFSCEAELDTLTASLLAANARLLAFLNGQNHWGRKFAGKAEREQAYAIHFPPAGRLSSDVPVTVRKIAPAEDITLPDGTIRRHVYREAGPYDLPATLDLLIRCHTDDTVLLLDYKTGRDWHGDFLLPEDLPQMRTLGLIPYLLTESLTESFEIPPIIVATLHAPRAVGEAPIEIYAEEFSQDTLERHIDALESAFRRAGDGSMRDGNACGKCPVRRTCPTQTAAVLQAAAPLVEGGLALIQRETAALTTPTDVGRLHYIMSQLKALEGPARRAIEGWMADNPTLPPVRPDGKVLVWKEKAVRRISLGGIEKQLGKLQGARRIAELTAEGLVETTTQQELHAVDDVF